MSDEIHDYDVARYDREGFLIVRRVFSPNEIDGMCSALSDFIRDTLPHVPNDQISHAGQFKAETPTQIRRMRDSAFFSDLARHERLTTIATTLIGEAAGAEEPEFFDRPPGSTIITPPHQDNYYFNQTPCKVATIWLALDSADSENGGLRYVSSSHLRGVRPHGYGSKFVPYHGITDYRSEDGALEYQTQLCPGDVVVHHGLTIHLANENRSINRRRRALAFVFRGRSCRLDDSVFPAVDSLREIGS